MQRGSILCFKPIALAVAAGEKQPLVRPVATWYDGTKASLETGRWGVDSKGSIAPPLTEMKGMDSTSAGTAYLARSKHSQAGLVSFFRRLLWQAWTGKDRLLNEALGKNSQPARPRKGKVLFIQPLIPPSFVDNRDSAPYGGFRYFAPPLGILTLAGCIPPDYDVEIRDENVGPVEYPTDADIVAMTGNILHPLQVQRIRSLSRYFRSQGKIICAGGPIANLTPEVLRPHCDVLFEGEGELTWPQFLKDYENGRHKDSYRQAELIDLSDSPVPRVDLINVDDYAIGSVQTTRGCPFTCEFCDIIIMYGRKVRKKPIPQVLREIELWADAGQQFIFFTDDNFTGNRPYAKELLREIVKFNSVRKYPVNFLTEASIDMAKDRELMELMREANFVSIFVGVESPRKDSLSETLKVQNVHTDDLVQAIQTIQSYGIFMSGGMIVGFDHDDKQIFDEHYDFLQRSGLLLAQVNVLHAIPKTPLYERLKASDRILPHAQSPLTNIKPERMTLQELTDGYINLVRRAYDYDAFLERYLVNLSSMRDHKFPLDRPRPKLSHTLGLLRLLGYFLITADARRRRFFCQMVAGTMRINPYAWRWVLRILVSFIHIAEYSRVRASIIEPPVAWHVEDFQPERAPVGSA